MHSDTRLQDFSGSWFEMEMSRASEVNGKDGEGERVVVVAHLCTKGRTSLL